MPTRAAVVPTRTRLLDPFRIGPPVPTPDQPCWDDQVAARCPMIRIPRKVGWLKPSRKSSIFASIPSSRIALADVHHHGPLEVGDGAGSAFRR
jgi:hypothetical protein